VPIESVLFDCDGTLVDSEILTREVLVDLARKFGIPLTLDDARDEFTGACMADVVEALAARRGAPLPESFVPEFRRRMAAAFREHLRPIDGAADLLESIRLPCSVASSGPREKIELSLALTNLRGYFEDRIYSAYEVGVWKPDPGLFLHAARVQGVAPDRCAVVEDSRQGIRAGLAAGMQVFAFQPSGAPALPAGGTRIRHLSELARYLPA